MMKKTNTPSRNRKITRQKIRKKLSQVRVIINHWQFQNSKIRALSGPVIQRSVAFDLSDDEEKPSEKRVTISEVTINDRDCDNSDSANQSINGVELSLLII